jgi:hypothetical protein
MLCINCTIKQLQRWVKTSLGVSMATYGNTPGTTPLGGMVQGKADIPQWSTQQSDAMLSAFSHLAQGLHISSPSLRRAITHHNISFADDTVAQNSQPPGAPGPITAVVCDLQHGTQVWNCLVQICGGQLALHKCSWNLIVRPNVWSWQMGMAHLQPLNSYLPTNQTSAWATGYVLMAPSYHTMRQPSRPLLLYEGAVCAPT